MRNEPTLEEFGYPREGIVVEDMGGGDGREWPQEVLSAHTCGSCKKFDHKDWVCTMTKEDRDPDCDTCENIDYEEEWLETCYGFRSPVRNEYSSDKAYEQACKAIIAINKWMDDMEREE